MKHINTLKVLVTSFTRRIACELNIDITKVSPIVRKGCVIIEDVENMHKP